MKKIILLSIVAILSNNVYAETPSADQNAKSFSEQNELACISDAIKQKTNQAPSDRYLSLLASIAFQNAHLPTTGQDTQRNIRVNNQLKENIQKRIIESIQTFGFCVENKLDKKGVVTKEKGYSNISSYKKDSPDDIRMLFISEYQSSENAKNKAAQEYFGFTSFNKINELFYTKDWNHKTQKQRQDFFRARLQTAMNEATLSDSSSRNVASSSDAIFEKNEVGEAAKECVKQLDGWTKPENDTIFNHNKGSVESENVALCKSMAKECGFSNDKFCESKNDVPGVMAHQITTNTHTSNSLFAIGKNNSDRKPSSEEKKEK